MALILTQLDAPMWRMVRDLYLKDKVVEALHEAERLGGQDSNDLFAEAEVRSKGKLFSLRPWLSLEAIVEQVEDSVDQVLEIVGTECESLSRRFGWDNREATRVSILPREVEESWMPGRWGYFVDKKPYDKICLPYHLAADLPELRRTIQHEFMHAITLNLCNGHEPRWLSEGMSTYAESRQIGQSWRGWRSGQATWMAPRPLDALLESDNRDEARSRERSLAYSQANALVRYLVHLKVESAVGSLLRSIGDESFLHNLESQVLGRSRTDSAIRSIYGLSEEQLFADTLSWIRSTPSPM